MTVERMRALVQEHMDFETKQDEEGVLKTLVENPLYEFYPVGLKIEGKESVRQFYKDHFHSFFPLIKSSTLVQELWGSQSACLEYDLYLKGPSHSERPFRIMAVLTREGSLLKGERFYGDLELIRLMVGPSWDRLISL